MKTKLTLTMDKTVIDNAKSFARNTGRSLSELVENYLENISQETQSKTISAKLERLIGSVQIPVDFDEKEEIRDRIEKKYFI